MTTGILVPAILVLAVSMAYPIQAGVNATLAGHVGHPLLAALVNTSVATIALVVVCLVARVPLPSIAAAGVAPWWAWTGGFLGATFVFSSLMLAPKLGAAGFVSTATVGTMLASLIIDQLGIVGYGKQAITPARVLGASLVIAGMLLIQWKR
ncbi:MAG: DMT family transporter [Rhodospirillales bacterium]